MVNGGSQKQLFLNTILVILEKENIEGKQKKINARVY